LACPECGADERTGWREASLYDGLELPEAAWDDDNDDSRQPRRDMKRNVNGIAWYWWCVAVAMLVLIALGVLAVLERI
jgi:hypothetical protein